MIHIITFADGFHHFSGAIEEYKKRIQHYTTIHVLSPSRKKQPSEIIEEETECLKKYLQENKQLKRSYKVYLDVGAHMTTTMDWYLHQESLFLSYPQCVYVIGGAYGIDPTIKKEIFSECRGLSPLTFPHSLALLILLEQIYRLNEIKKRSKYHHSDERLK